MATYSWDVIRWWCIRYTLYAIPTAVRASCKRCWPWICYLCEMCHVYGMAWIGKVKIWKRKGSHVACEICNLVNFHRHRHVSLVFAILFCHFSLCRYCNAEMTYTTNTIWRLQTTLSQTHCQTNTKTKIRIFWLHSHQHRLSTISLELCRSFIYE